MSSKNPFAALAAANVDSIVEKQKQKEVLLLAEKQKKPAPEKKPAAEKKKEVKPAAPAQAKPAPAKKEEAKPAAPKEAKAAAPAKKEEAKPAATKEAPKKEQPKKEQKPKAEAPATKSVPVAGKKLTITVTKKSATEETETERPGARSQPAPHKVPREEVEVREGKRQFERRSGTNQKEGTNMKKGGHGVGNWGEKDVSNADVPAMDDKTDETPADSKTATAEPETAPEPETKTVDQFLAESKQKKKNLPTIEAKPRIAGEGEDNSKWGTTAVVKTEQAKKEKKAKKTTEKKTEKKADTLALSEVFHVVDQRAAEKAAEREEKRTQRRREEGRAPVVVVASPVPAPKKQQAVPAAAEFPALGRRGPAPVAAPATAVAH